MPGLKIVHGIQLPDDGVAARKKLLGHVSTEPAVDTGDKPFSLFHKPLFIRGSVIFVSIFQRSQATGRAILRFALGILFALPGPFWIALSFRFPFGFLLRFTMPHCQATADASKTSLISDQ